MTRLRMSLSLHGLSAGLLVLGVFFEAFAMLRVSGGVTVGDALILVSAVLLLVQAIQGRALIWMPIWILIALPLIVAGTAIALISGEPLNRADVIVAIELSFCAIGLPVILASQSPDRDFARRLVVAWVAGNLAGAAVAYLQFHRFDLGPLNRWLVWNSGRIAGMTPNPNTLGASLALVAPMCLAFALEARRPLRMARWVIALIACVHVIDLTGSRTSIGAVALGCTAVLLAFATRTRVSELPLRLLQVVAVLAVIGLAWHFRAAFHDSAIERLLGHSASAGISSYFRDALRHASLQAIVEAPFLGYGYSHMAGAAHNVPMALVQGGGLAGFAGFLLAQAGLLLVAVQLYFQSRLDPDTRAVSIGMLGVWCAWIGLGIYDVSVLSRIAYIAFGFSVLWLATTRATQRRAAIPAMDVQPRAA